MAPDLTRIAALPGQGGGIASHPHLEELRKVLPDRKESAGSRLQPAQALMHFPVGERAVQARARALAALDRAEAHLPEPPCLHAVADPALGWKLTPAAHVVKLLHTPRPGDLIAYREPAAGVPPLPRFLNLGT